MRDVLPELMQWWRAGETVGVGTVVATFRSAPRPAGASMLVGPGGEAVGSVSGGCVEGAVYELGQEVVASGAPVLQRYGVCDDDAFAVGLTCGGILDVFVETVSQRDLPRARRGAPTTSRPAARWRSRPSSSTPTRPGSGGGSSCGPRTPPGCRPASLGQRARRRARSPTTPAACSPPAAPRRSPTAPTASVAARGMRVFVAAYAPRPRMLVFGAIDFAAAVAHVGTFLGYRVTVCDARPVFATASRFPAADEVVVEWPHRYLAAEVEAGRIDERTVVCVLTHDPKFDVPLLEVALRLPEVAYVGAMGSRRTHDDRLERLREAGLTEAELARLSSPIGLDLGARTPEETAVSIAAEIVALQWGGGGQRLQETGRRDPPPPGRRRFLTGKAVWPAVTCGSCRTPCGAGHFR